MQKILINASQDEEVRVALVDGKKLFDLNIEYNSQYFKSGNIYRAKIARVEPSLDAAFVDYGHSRHGFLPLKEIAKEYFRRPANKPFNQLSISDVTAKGRELLVQVVREERGDKGAALSTYVNLVGRYVVLAANNKNTRGISRRITGSAERKRTYEMLNALQLGEGEGVIIRTYAIDHSVDELREDMAYLRELWQSIRSANTSKRAPSLIYRDGPAITRTLRDHFNKSIEEIVVDSQEAFSIAEGFLQRFKPECIDRLKLHQSTVPLFVHYQIENQISSAYRREVRLPSGGSIFFDQTEAMLAIDINSAKSTKGQDSEATALHTNIEAAQEIALQLRLRDVGGLIVIDFIDMHSSANKEAVESEMLQAMHFDKARYYIGNISRFGLMEMSRQRMRPSLDESSQVACPHCHGSGVIRTVESMTMFILRALAKEAGTAKSAVLAVHVPVDVACYLLNEKNNEIGRIEKQSGKRVFVLPDKGVDIPDYRISPCGQKDTKLSYQMLPKPGLIRIVSSARKANIDESQAAVSYVPIDGQATMQANQAQPTNLNRWDWLKRLMRRAQSQQLPAQQPSQQPSQPPAQQPLQQPVATAAMPSTDTRPKRRASHTRHHRQNRRRYGQPRERSYASSSSAPRSGNRSGGGKPGSGLYRKRTKERAYLNRNEKQAQLNKSSTNQPIGREYAAAAYPKPAAAAASESKKPVFDQQQSQTNWGSRTFAKTSHDKNYQPLQSSNSAAKDLSDNAPFRDIRAPASTDATVNSSATLSSSAAPRKPQAESQAAAPAAWPAKNKPTLSSSQSAATEPAMLQIKTKK